MLNYPCNHRKFDNVNHGQALEFNPTEIYDDPWNSIILTMLTCCIIIIFVII